MKAQSLITVLLPVYNAQAYVARAIESILQQDFHDFELLILNDGSTDGSEEIIKGFKDERIRYVCHANIGLAATLNKGIELAKGLYIARQDNDDISLPGRLGAQVGYFEKHPNCVLLGTAAEIIDQAGQSTGRYHRHSCESAELKFDLLFNNPFVHSTVMFRKADVLKAGAYYTGKEVFEDYALWSNMAKLGEINNLPEVYLQYREVHSGMSKSAVDYAEKVKTQSLRNIQQYCAGLSEKEISRFCAAMSGSADYVHDVSLPTLVEATLAQLSANFGKQEKMEANVLNKRLKSQQITFYRHLYNAILLSPEVGPMKKVMARIKRKVLFTFNPSYI